MNFAQVNIGRMRGASPDDPIMAEFIENLDAINALAEAQEGFVWRLVGDGNNATDLRPYADQRMILNLSVWSSVEALRQYVYRTVHRDFVRRRAEWFEGLDQTHYAIWPIEGERTTIDEAKSRLEHLRRHGDSDHAFTFVYRYTGAV